MLVLILRHDTKVSDKNIEYLKDAFSDPYFITTVIHVNDPTVIPSTSTLTPAEYLQNYRMRRALTYATEGPYIKGIPTFKWRNLPCIIIKDTSVTNITPRGMRDRIMVALDPSLIRCPKECHRKHHNPDPQNLIPDLVFLCTWSDLCSSYRDISCIEFVDGGSTLKWTFQPTADQAILYSPKTRDYIADLLVNSTSTFSSIINSNVGQGNLQASTFVPNIVDYDVNFATSNSDYAKLNKCTLSTDPNDNVAGSAAALLWFAIIVVVLIIMAYILIVIGPKT